MFNEKAEKLNGRAAMVGFIAAVGSYLATDDTERGAALAVLNATNRYLGNTVFSR